MGKKEHIQNPSLLDGIPSRAPLGERRLLFSPSVFLASFALSTRLRRRRGLRWIKSGSIHTKRLWPPTPRGRSPPSEPLAVEASAPAGWGAKESSNKGGCSWQSIHPEGGLIQAKWTRFSRASAKLAQIDRNSKTLKRSSVAHFGLWISALPKLRVSVAVGDGQWNTYVKRTVFLWGACTQDLRYMTEFKLGRNIMEHLPGTCFQAWRKIPGHKGASYMKGLPTISFPKFPTQEDSGFPPSTSFKLAPSTRCLGLLLRSGSAPAAAARAARLPHEVRGQILVAPGGGSQGLVHSTPAFFDKQ